MLGLVSLTPAQLAFVATMVFVAGFVDSIAGGGGLISLPAYLAAGLPPHAALATNKFSSCMGTLTAVARFYRAGKVSFRLGLAATAGALVGSALGTRIALAVSEGTIRTIVLVLVPVVLVLFLGKDRLVKWLSKPPQSSEYSASAVSLPPADRARGLLTAGMLGFVIGTYDGFFGPGTGTFLAVGFHLLARLDLTTASGNARLANLASNTGSLLVFLLAGKVIFPLAAVTAAAGVLGNILGAGLAVRRGERVIRPLMVGVLILLMIHVVRQQFGL